jgi:hypothetical protein
LWIYSYTSLLDPSNHIIADLFYPLLILIKFSDRFSEVSFAYFSPANRFLFDENHWKVIGIDHILLVFEYIDYLDVERDVKFQSSQDEFASGTSFTTGSGKQLH